MIMQAGATLVRDNEEFWNAIKTFELLFPNYIPEEKNVGIITPGGGASVNLTDLFASHGLNVPNLTQDSQDRLAEILPDVNVNIKNPIDLGAVGFVVGIFIKCIKIVARDPNVDIIIVPLWPEQLYYYVFKRMIKIQKSTKKPFAFCLPSIADDAKLVRRFEKGRRLLHEHRVLYYFSPRDAANNMAHYCDYVDYLKSRGLIPSH